MTLRESFVMSWLYKKVMGDKGKEAEPKMQKDVNIRTVSNGTGSIGYANGGTRQGRTFQKYTEQNMSAESILEQMSQTEKRFLPDDDATPTKPNVKRQKSNSTSQAGSPRVVTPGVRKRKIADTPKRMPFVVAAVDDDTQSKEKAPRICGCIDCYNEAYGNPLPDMPIARVKSTVSTNALTSNCALAQSSIVPISPMPDTSVPDDIANVNSNGCEPKETCLFPFGLIDKEKHLADKQRKEARLRKIMELSADRRSDQTVKQELSQSQTIPIVTTTSLMSTSKSSVTLTTTDMADDGQTGQTANQSSNQNISPIIPSFSPMVSASPTSTTSTIPIENWPTSFSSAGQIPSQPLNHNPSTSVVASSFLPSVSSFSSTLGTSTTPTTSKAPDDTASGQPTIELSNQSTKNSISSSFPPVLTTPMAPTTSVAFTIPISTTAPTVTTSTSTPTVTSASTLFPPFQFGPIRSSPQQIQASTSANTASVFGTTFQEPTNTTSTLPSTAKFGTSSPLFNFGAASSVTPSPFGGRLTSPASAQGSTTALPFQFGSGGLSATPALPASVQSTNQLSHQNTTSPTSSSFPTVLTTAMAPTTSVSFTLPISTSTPAVTSTSTSTVTSAATSFPPFQFGQIRSTPPQIPASTSANTASIFGNAFQQPSNTTSTLHSTFGASSTPFNFGAATSAAPSPFGAALTSPASAQGSTTALPFQFGSGGLSTTPTLPAAPFQFGGTPTTAQQTPMFGGIGGVHPGQQSAMFTVGGAAAASPSPTRRTQLRGRRYR